ncbi:hypothetical protein N7494_010146 [Penicillium frequentans]|uniref:NB-ARC domain-containing protein n=1 Tax=Penicillium frequentans TaxID=3151616 RepID=A0AAD6CSZ5_9EURO|nr:hypothetical protein N7494_010146 [Penicillium glabrum]
MTANIYMTERAQTPTEPLSTVPFSRNPEFVDRGSLMADTTLLSDIHEKCSAPDARLALVGMGGVGKSQMVIEYCYRTRVTSPGTWVFWVHASNAFRFEQGYREIAEQARIPRCRDSDADLMRSVVNWLRDLKRKWILVLDNLDDNRFLNEPRYSEGGEVDAKMPPVGYLPHSANGSIIITTRDRRVALDLVDDNCIVQIDPMTQPEAVSLLDRMLGDQGKEPNRADVLKLAETLEYMPLAIEQAAAYIRRQFPLYSIQQYIRDFERSDDERLRLLAHEAGRHYRDWEAKNSILVTWQLSFNQIRAENPSAAALLSLMSFFDRQAIPEALLHIQSTEHDQNDMHDTSISTLNKGGIWVEVRTPIRGRVRQVLHDRFNWLRPSFWTAGARSRDHQIPKPAELATRNWLKFNGEFDKWLEDFMCRLENAITQDNYEQQGWAACRLLLPHVESARLQRPSSDALVIQWGILLYRTACYLSEGEVPGVLLPLLLASKQAFEQCLGPENKLTIYSAIHVAFTHSKADCKMQSYKH